MSDTQSQPNNNNDKLVSPISHTSDVTVFLGGGKSLHFSFSFDGSANYAYWTILVYRTVHCVMSNTQG